MSIAIFKQVLQAVHHIHSHEVAHLDLKLENIFIGDDYQVKVADLDLSSPIKMREGFVGTPNYMPPEMWEEKFYRGDDVDVFALGVILFSLLTGTSPFYKADKDDPLYKLVRQKKAEEFWANFEENGVVISQMLKKLIFEMLCYKKELRPPVREILRLAWLDQTLIDKEVYVTEMQKRFALISVKN